MARCANCGAEAEDVKFCPECGRKFVPVEAPVAAGEDGLYYCFRHKKTTTRITCGRCEKPICVKCMINGPAGVRCRECARNRVQARPLGILHDLFGLIGRTMRPLGASPYIAFIVVMIIIRMISGCFHR